MSSRFSRALMVAMLVLLAPAGARAEQVLRIGYLLSQNSQLGAGAKAFADEVRKQTGGRFRVEQFPNGELGGEVEMIQAVQSGQVDVALITNAPFTNIIPEFGVFDVPFLFRNAHHAHAVLDGPIGPAAARRGLRAGAGIQG